MIGPLGMEFRPFRSKMGPFGIELDNSCYTIKGSKTIIQPIHPQNDIKIKNLKFF